MCAILSHTDQTRAYVHVYAAVAAVLLRPTLIALVYHETVHKFIYRRMRLNAPHSRLPMRAHLCRPLSYILRTGGTREACS